MAKPIRKVSSRKGQIGRGKGQIATGRRVHKTPKRKIQTGVIHIQASFNNTMVTITDLQGLVIVSGSAGYYGFKGKRRGTPFAAHMAARNAIRRVADQGMQRAEVMIKGPGLGRDAALRAIRRSGSISKGVANGSAGSPIIDGSRTANPTLQAIVPRITTGNIYKRSLGHADLLVSLR
ncbi:hypothetical protein VNO77_48713 [Canavalia gladiata]|uniref:Ribosomal protein S11 n=1 Tax=Canavalia gladiata TaxID=3824 RepID=A0AAN9JFP5_CANGL